MKRVGIIGFGTVGEAVYSSIKFNHDCCRTYDPENPNLISCEWDEIVDRDIVFICVPTPANADGSCDDHLVIEYVELLKDFSGCLVIKSTIPPSTVDKVMKIRPTTVIWPEMLRSNNGRHDIKYPEIIVIGAPSDIYFSYISSFIQFETEIMWNRSNQAGRVDSKIKRCSPVEASIFKYVVNSFLAMKVVYFHQLWDWMQNSGRGDSYLNVTKLLEEEGRVGKSHMKAPGEHGLGYAGDCFPKDVEAFIHQIFHNDRTTHQLLYAVQQQNADLRRSWTLRPHGEDDE